MSDDRSPDTSSTSGERIAKRLARVGLCSRRDAERWIAEGRVAVNGKVLDSPAHNVRPGDRIVVDGKPIPDKEPTRVWRYHKPAGLVTTARDEKGRATVFDRLPEDMPRVISVGRLDLNTEGLLLLTNDGALARHLELPATGWPRRYRVRVHGAPDPARLASLAHGITLDGVEYGPIEAAVDREQGSNAWLTVTLREGKNREIRKVLEHLGLAVNRLIRVSYGPFQLGKLDEGTVEEVPRRVLRDQLPQFFPKGEAASDTPRAAPRLRFDAKPKTAAAPARTAGKPSAARGRASDVLERERQDRAAPTGRRPEAKPARAPRSRDQEVPQERWLDEPMPEGWVARKPRADRPARSEGKGGPARSAGGQDAGGRGAPDRAERRPASKGSAPKGAAPAQSRRDPPLPKLSDDVRSQALEMARRMNRALDRSPDTDEDDTPGRKPRGGRPAPRNRAEGAQRSPSERPAGGKPRTGGPGKPGSGRTGSPREDGPRSGGGPKTGASRTGGAPKAGGGKPSPKGGKPGGSRPGKPGGSRSGGPGADRRR
ncbi:MAG TPA: pseudouridine synthase [Azospirillaceae bacterium]|nr:pseudouridine synthase [Azospirillaceae bacterium]